MDNSSTGSIKQRPSLVLGLVGRGAFPDGLTGLLLVFVANSIVLHSCYDGRTSERFFKIF